MKVDVDRQSLLLEVTADRRWWNVRIDGAAIPLVKEDSAQRLAAAIAATLRQEEVPLESVVTLQTSDALRSAIQFEIEEQDAMVADSRSWEVSHLELMYLESLRSIDLSGETACLDYDQAFSLEGCLQVQIETAEEGEDTLPEYLAALKDIYEQLPASVKTTAERGR